MGVGPDEIVELKAGEGQYWLAVQLGVIKTVQQMNSAGSGGRQAHSQPASELGVGAGHECRRLLVAHLHKANPVLMSAQRFHDAVDAVAGQTENYLHTPINQRFGENIRSIHDSLPASVSAVVGQVLTLRHNSAQKTVQRKWQSIRQLIDLPGRK